MWGLMGVVQVSCTTVSQEECLNCIHLDLWEGSKKKNTFLSSGVEEY